MRSEQQYLTDIVEAADAIVRFMVDTDREAFLTNELRQSAVMQKIGVIGEAAGKVSPELRAQYPDVEWPNIVGMRNILVHSYFSIKQDIIWQTATQAVPDLREKIAHILDHEFSSSD